MARRTGRGTVTPCPKLSSKQKASLLRKLEKESHESVFERWKDPTHGRQSARKKQLEECGDECYGCPNEGKPMYPVCGEGCAPRCAGIAAAVGYAGRLGATGVRENLREAEAECRKLRSAVRRKSSKTKRRAGSSRSSKGGGRSRPRGRARSQEGRRQSRRGSSGRRR